MIAPPSKLKPLRLSWSRLRVHQECREKGALLAAGRKSPVADVRQFFPGTVADRCLRAWLSEEDPKLGQMAAMVATVADVEEKTAKDGGDGIVKWRGTSDKQKVISWCRDLVTRLEPIIVEHVLSFDYQPAVRFEVPLTVPHLDGTPTEIRLIGEMDLLVRVGEKTHHLWDLKATEDGNYWRKTVGQLVFYEIAHYGMFGFFPGVSGLIQPMCDQQVLMFNITDEQRRQMFVAICDTAADIWRGDLPPKSDNIGCDWCPVHHACSKHARSRGRQGEPARTSVL